MKSFAAHKAKALRFAKWALMITAGLFAVIAASLWLYIAQAGGLVAWLEDRLSVQTAGIQTKIEQADIAFFEEGLSAALHVKNVTVSVGAQQVTFPKLSLVTSFALLWQGQSWQAELSQLDVDLVQDETGFALVGDWADVAAMFADEPAKATDNDAPSDSLYSLLAHRQLLLTNSRVQLRKQGRGAIIGLDDVTLKLTMDEANRLLVDGRGHIINHKQSSVAFNGFRDMRSGLADLKLEIDGLPALPMADFLPETMAPLADFGVIDMTAHVTADKTLLQTASVEFSARDGRLADTVPFTILSSSLRYSRVDDYMVLPDLRLALPDGQEMQLSGEAVGLSLPKTGFSADMKLQDVPINSLLTQWPKTALPDVRAYMIKSLSGGDFAALQVGFKGQYDKTNQAMSLSNLSLNGEIAEVLVDTGFGQYEQFVGTANGSLAFEVSSGGTLKQAAIQLAVNDGYLRTTPMPSALHFAQASASMRYRPGLFEADDIKVLFTTEGRLSADIEVGFDKARALDHMKITMQAPRLSHQAVQHLFPKNLAPAVTDLMKTKITQGAFDDISLAVEAAQGAGDGRADNQSLKITQLDLDATLSDMGVTYLEGQAPLRDLSGLLTLRDNEMTIFLDEGQTDAFALSSAQIRLAPVVASSKASRDLAITADATASLPDVMPLLQAPQIDVIADLPVNITKATGRARARLKLQSDIQPDRDFELKLLGIDATIQEGAVPGFIAGYDLADADLVLGYDEGGLVVSGSARLADVVGDFTARQKVTPTGSSFEISGQIEPQEAVSHHITRLSGQEIAGAVGGQFVIESQDSGETITAHLAADLAQASLYSPLIDWAKLHQEPGTIAASAHLVNGALRRIENLQVDFSDLRGTGQIEMTDQGQFSAAYLKNLYWPGNEIDEVIVERTGKDSYHLIADGPQIDLRPLRSNNNNDEAIALSFDVTSPHLVIDDGISLVGQMTGKLDDDGAGEATLQGALQRDEAVLLSEGTITAYFGEGGEYLNAIGLIGGAESRLEFSPDGTGGALLIITTQNAGRVLSGLGITDAVRAGRMVLTNHYPDSDFNEFTTTINLEEFNVIEAPTAVRAFSVLGLAGLYSLVEGDGTKFTTGEVVIETSGTKHDLKKLSASGGALGVTMVGTYDRHTGQVDMSGNLVPVNQFSKLVGAVPLLGNLLSGTDKTGIFATQFNVSGPIDDPQTSVNAASLVPGVLRDLFSPEWLQKEAGRLFGSGDDQAGDNQTE